MHDLASRDEPDCYRYGILQCQVYLTFRSAWENKLRTFNRGAFKTVVCPLVLCRHDLGATPQAGLQSFRVLLTPLTYIPVGHIDITTCQACDGTLKVIACIEDPLVIRKILDHLDRTKPITRINSLPEPRAPPQASLFNTT